MKRARVVLRLAMLTWTVAVLGQDTNTAVAANTPQEQPSQQLPAARLADLKASDGTILKANIGQDHLRAGEPKLAIEVFKLNLLAYPESADANDDLADAYFADGQKDLARQHAEQVLALLDAHRSPASSWSDTEPRRREIRHDAENVLKKLSRSANN